MFEMQIEGGIPEGIAVVFLSICAVFDIRKREIPLALLMLGMITAAGIDVWQMVNRTLSIAEVGAALLPGTFFLAVSFLTGEKVGYGDGLLLLTEGLLAGLYRCCFALLIGLVTACVCSLLLLVFRRVQKNSVIPFAPFLAIGMGVVFFV